MDKFVRHLIAYIVLARKIIKRQPYLEDKRNAEFMLSANLRQVVLQHVSCTINKSTVVINEHLVLDEQDFLALDLQERSDVVIKLSLRLHLLKRDNFDWHFQAPFQSVLALFRQKF